jgi:hypothetical protein
MLFPISQPALAAIALHHSAVRPPHPFSTDCENRGHQAQPPADPIDLDEAEEAAAAANARATESGTRTRGSNKSKAPLAL